MKILGVNICYDLERTMQAQQIYQKLLSEETLRWLRIYEVTNEHDMHRKYCRTFNRGDVFRLHVRIIAAYWMRRLRSVIKKIKEKGGFYEKKKGKILESSSVRSCRKI